MAESTLIAAAGARFVERAELERVEPPPATRTWVPIKHVTLLDRVKTALTDASFEIRETKTVLARNDHRMFTTIDTRSELAGPSVTLAIGVVNSTDRSLPMKFIAGNRVLACSNLALRSDIMSAVVRKHTTRGIDRFYEALSKAVRSLDQFKAAETNRIRRFMETEISDTQAESLMLRSYERGVISHRLLPQLITEWRKPSHDYGCPPKSLWVLEQAHTTVLGEVARSNSQRFCGLSLRLQGVLSEVAGIRPDEEIAPLSV